MNRKKAQRLYREEGLSVCKRDVMAACRGAFGLD